MQPNVLTQVSHRARFAWLGTALAASLACFALSRPTEPAPRHNPGMRSIGACGGIQRARARAMVHRAAATRADDFYHSRPRHQATTRIGGRDHFEGAIVLPAD